jgi:hypothetical protein
MGSWRSGCGIGSEWTRPYSLSSCSCTFMGAPVFLNVLCAVLRDRLAVGIGGATRCRKGGVRRTAAPIRSAGTTACRATPDRFGISKSCRLVGHRSFCHTRGARSLPRSYRGRAGRLARPTRPMAACQPISIGGSSDASAASPWLAFSSWPSPASLNSHGARQIGQRCERHMQRHRHRYFIAAHVGAGCGRRWRRGGCGVRPRRGRESTAPDPCRSAAIC